MTTSPNTESLKQELLRKDIQVRDLEIASHSKMFWQRPAFLGFAGPIVGVLATYWISDYYGVYDHQRQLVEVERATLEMQTIEFRQSQEEEEEKFRLLVEDHNNRRKQLQLQTRDFEKERDNKEAELSHISKQLKEAEKRIDVLEASLSNALADNDRELAQNGLPRPVEANSASSSKALDALTEAITRYKNNLEDIKNALDNASPIITDSNTTSK